MVSRSFNMTSLAIKMQSEAGESMSRPLIMIIDGAPTARHGDKCACGATLIAVQAVSTGI